MVDTEAVWQGIEACANDLPHKVEWQDGTRTMSVMHTMFVVPHHIVELFGASADLYGRCDALAKKRQCKFFKANDGSYVFQRA